MDPGSGATFAGTLNARCFDPTGKLLQDYPAMPLHGKRLTLP